MKPSELLNTHREAVRAIVAAHRAANPRVFGSVARGEDTEQSDVDILVDPNPRTSLFDIGGIQYGLSELLGVDVDVVTPDALPEIFRNHVLGEAVPI
jgi:predicted nucleotidyltransferase